MQSKKVAALIEEEGARLKTLGFLICKCHSKLVMQQYEEFQSLQKDEDGDEEMKESESKMKQVKFDNLYDLLFDDDGKQKTQFLN